MGKIKLLHAADLHLDSPFEGLTAQKAAIRRSEQRALLAKLVNLAKQEDVQLVLLPGDLLDSDSVYRETAVSLNEALRAFEVPVFIAPGNHDCYSQSAPYANPALPENVYVFKTGRLECVRLPELGVRVWGAGFTDEYSPPLLRGCTADDTGDIDLCCLHGDALTASSPYNAVTEEDIAQSGMDYIALGHCHSFSGLNRAGSTFYAWPGCTEGRGFDETGKKGAVVATVGQGACDLRFVPLGSRQYVTQSIDVSGAVNPLERVLGVLPEDCGRDIYKLVLTGERDGSTTPGTAMYRELENRFFALRIKDRTTPGRDVWESEGEDTLRGLFLAKLRQRYDEAVDDNGRALIASAARWGVNALDNVDIQ